MKLPEGPDPDGAWDLLDGCFGDDPAAWVADSYDLPLDRAVLDRLFRLEPLDRAAVAALNPDFDADAVREEADLTGITVDLSRPRS